MMMNNETPEMELPGFRFHPTEEELLDFYLKTIVFGKKLRFNVIGFLDIYQHDPWDLPDLAKIGEREWYFFVPRDVKHGNGGRPNRTTEHGFWKATGSDRCIRSLSDSKRVLGLKKTLVFYTGRAPRGCKTDWVMNEYRMPQNSSSAKGNIVLCKIYRKATSLKVMEERAAMEGELKSVPVSLSAGDTKDITPLHEKRRKLTVPITTLHEINVLGPNVEEPVESKENDVKNSLCASSSSMEFARADLPELQLPKFNLEWMQESYWTQLRSPWLDSWTPYASLLND